MTWTRDTTVAVGTGTPEGVVTGPTGKAYYDTTNEVEYRKRSGTGNTGWDARDRWPWVFYQPVGTSGGSWNHGPFWLAGVDLGRFFWEAWVCPQGGSGGSGQYWLSEGYGGAHAILMSPVNGNLSSTGSDTAASFTSDYTPEDGEWMHSAVSWDGANIRTYANGVVTSVTAYTGARRAQQGTLYIAGSDHSNLHGRIAGVRGWESGSPTVSPYPYYYLNNGFDWPFTPDAAFVPFQAVARANRAQFAADYTRPALTVPDISDGFPAGTPHHGGQIGAGALANPIRGGGSAVGYFVRDPTCPLRQDIAVTPARTLPTAPATPGSAKIFDSFSRAQSLLAFGAPTLGSTETGSLGPKVWSVRDPSLYWFGIQDGRAVFQGTTWGEAWVANNSADMDVRVDRRAVSGLHQTGIAFRVVDGGNLLSAYTTGTLTGATINLQSHTAASPTAIASYSAPASWTTLRVVTSGTTITVYCDATQVGQATGVTTHQSAVNAGLYAGGGSTAGRWDNFTVL